MLEKHYSAFQCPIQRSSATDLDVQERRVINGVDHIYRGRILFGDKAYPIEDGILRFGAHTNEALYDRMWQADDSTSRGHVGPAAREKMLFLLGCKTLGFLENKTLVDIGAGLGYRTQAAAQLGADVIALDSSFQGLKRGMERMASQLSSEQYARVDVVQADIMQNVFALKQFDIVFSSYALHHTSNTHEALTTISKYVKNGGYLIVTVFVPEDNFPNTLWVCRSEVLSVPRDIRLRALAKASILPQNGIAPLINIPELLRIIDSDPDLAQISSAIGLRYLTHRENLDTEHIWIQSQEEIARWMTEEGFFVEFQKGETTVGRLIKPGLMNYIKRYCHPAMIIRKISKSIQGDQ
jgi:2-polyprenyl-3-methyl-5-hydroxy-6-metoxy-1,4-benzoquinol methylase